MTSAIYKLTITLALLTFLAGCKISGKVILGDHPVKGIKVKLVHLENFDTSETTTGVNGEYSFAALTTGNYEVIVQPPAGYTRQLREQVVKHTRMQAINKVDFIATQTTLTNTNNGKVIGQLESNGSLSWYGIPYAAPPINELRWKAPRPAASWDDNIYLATQLPIECAQGAGLMDVLSGYAKEEGDRIGTEDCLFLNIYAPENAHLSSNPLEPLPVMVWIHGGSNTGGTPNLYKASAFASKHNIVVVTIAYRLGLFGWFSHPAMATGNALDDSGNYGTLDIIQALEWVQQNINHFGGNPDNVTLFGESAGGWNVTSMLITPKAKGLFHKAIAQSGSIKTHSLEYMQNYIEDGGYGVSGKEVFNKLLIGNGTAQTREEAISQQDAMDSAAIKDQLINASIDDILRTGNTDGDPKRAPLHYNVTPVNSLSMIQDGVVFPKVSPSDLFKSTDTYNSVPLILGSNRNEFAGWLAEDEDFVNKIGDIPIAVKNKNRYALYNEYKSNIWTITAVDSIATTITSNPDHQNVYTYFFTWDNILDIPFIDLPFLFGAAHALEIPFVFGDFRIAPPPFNLVYTPHTLAERVALSDSMTSYWAEFAYHGNPGNGRHASELQTWHAWSNDVSGPKKIVFDSEQDGGIHMTTDSQSLDGLLNDLLIDDRFRDEADRCEIYRAIEPDCVDCCL